MASPEVATKMKTYKVDTELPLNRRLAHLFEWGANNLPHHYIPFNLVVRGVMGYGHTPQPRGKEVKEMQKRMGAARAALEEEYGRELLVQRGLGARATVDSEDVVKNKLPQRTTRFLSAKAALARTVERVDLKELPRRSAEDKTWADWAVDVAQTMNQLGTGKLDNKLLPPGDGAQK